MITQNKTSIPVFTTEVYIVCGDEVLMFKRSETKKKFPGFWSIPGGHVEIGEDPLTSAIREVKEETGIVVTPEHMKLKVVAMHNHLDRGEMYVAFAYIVKIKKKTTLNNETSEGSSHWIRKEDAMKKENVFEPIAYYFDHVLGEKPGIIYNRSEWKDSKLVKVLSENIGSLD